MIRPDKNAQERIEDLKGHLRPVRYGTVTVPPRLKGVAVRLSYKIGTEVTGWLFDVDSTNISQWRNQSNKEGLGKSYQ